MAGGRRGENGLSADHPLSYPRFRSFAEMSRHVPHKCPAAGGCRMALARTIRFPIHVFGVSASCLVESQWKSPFVNRDRKSTRLNSSHLGISYAVFCLKKKTQ